MRIAGKLDLTTHNIGVKEIMIVRLPLALMMTITLISFCKSYSRIEDEYSMIDPKGTLKCHRREFTYKVLRKDRLGRKCTDYITAMSCWGRCDSNEIADWRFPFKKSYHPVCIHDKMRLRRVRLRKCEEGAEKEARLYEFVEAVTCSCQVCKSSGASCQGMHYRQARKP
ncbi:Thyrostimulin beta-5 subunit [Nymphon striatum]|nr:Thyrostimulin beta-5 subunit [Nymphon striatum]